MPKRACDRCHQLKERCLKSSTIEKCDRCLRLNLECLTTRPQRKAGRTPAFSRLITYQNPITSCQGSKLEEFGPHVDNQEARRAQNPGCPRPPSKDASYPDSLCSIADTTVQDRYLLSLALGDTKSAGRYVIGPSFHETHQRSLIKGLQTAPALLKDAFISCSTLIAAGKGIEIDAAIQQHCQQRAAVSVALLRNIQLRNKEEASSCLLLGFLLATFAKYVALGEVLALCRHTLSQIKIYEINGNFKTDDDRCFLKHLVLTETVECLFQAEMPVLRLERDESETVDRFLGISSSLLAPLDSLARVSCILRNGNGDTWTMQKLNDVASFLSEWTPSVDPARLSVLFEPDEVNYMLRQAKLMRETLLLIIHRLQTPYRSLSPRADELSSSICHELELLKAETGRMLNFASLSLMAIAFEVDDPSREAEALDRIERLTSLSPFFQTRLRRSLQMFWSAKAQQRPEHQRLDLYWYDVSRYYVSPLSVN